MININTHTLRDLVDAANLIIETNIKPTIMGASNPDAPKKIGKIKYWRSLRGKEYSSRQEEADFTRKIKSSLPNAHWYFVENQGISSRSNVFLITTDGVRLANVFRNKRVNRGSWGAWEIDVESFGEVKTRMGSFADIKVPAEELARKKIEEFKSQKETT